MNLSTCRYFAISLTLSLALSSTLWAQRPTAPKLFSQKALVYARIDDTRELKDKFSQTSMGKLSEDPQLKPILSSFYSSFTSLAQGLQGAIGVSLDELLSIPNGEFAIALIPTKAEPVFCGLLEAGDELPAVELMIGRLQDNLKQQGSEMTTKEIGKITVTKFKNSLGDRGQFGFFTNSGVLVFSSKAEYIETLAEIWQGSGIDHKSLADNRDFTTILSRCIGTEGERPQASFYVNPIALYRELSKQSNGSTAVLGILRTLGVDGIKGVGGSAIFAPNDFDSIVHAHILMENNRRGVLRAIRPKSGSTDPEAWVHDQVVSYGTMNWDIEKTIKAIAEIVDSFAGENAFENNVIANGSKQIGVDVRKDLLDMIADRISMAQVILPPKKINSQSNLFGIHIKEPQRMKTEVLPKLFDKLKTMEARWASKLVGDSTIYYMDVKSPSENVRLPAPAMAMVGDDLLVSDALSSIEYAIKTFSNGEDLLSDALEYKLVRDRIKAQLRDKETSIMLYQRPEENLRLFYDLASDPENINRLEQIATNNPFFTALVAALRSRELPKFEVIAKYLAPGGAFVVEEEDGLHYTAFGLRRE